MAHKGVGIVGNGYGVGIVAEEERVEARKVDSRGGEIGSVADESEYAVEGLEARRPFLLICHIDIGGESLATEKLGGRGESIATDEDVAEL